MYTILLKFHDNKIIKFFSMPRKGIEPLSVWLTAIYFTIKLTRLLSAGRIEPPSFDFQSNDLPLNYAICRPYGA